MNAPTKTPLYSEELERDINGAMLLEKECIMQIMAILKPECFYVDKYRQIFTAIRNLDAKGADVDLRTVTEELKRTSKLDSVGGAYEVSACTNKVASSAHSETHALLIYQYFLTREMSKLGMKLHNLANEPNADPIELFLMAQRELTAIDYIGKSNVKVVGDVVVDILKQNGPDKAPMQGIPTGFANIDKYFTKQKQEFGILAARPGMGKTAFMLAMARNAAVDYGKPVAIFSLEMSTEKLVGRLMASEASVSSSDINRKTLKGTQMVQLENRVTKLYDAPIYIDDTPDLDIVSLRSKIRRLKSMYKIEEVYIDYLQLMAGEKKGNREQEISYITRQLKKTAKQEEIPITALCQLSRKVDERPNKKPILSDLRESGSIEQDADWVMSLFRPEYYGIENEQTKLYEEETFNGKHLPAENLLVVDQLKYREGSLFKAALKCYLEIMHIENYGPKESDQLSVLDNNIHF
jgi:replicative DNA helicase